MKIILHMASQELLQQIQSTLDKQGIKARLTKRYLQINGETYCRKFIEKVGFSNDHHKSKLSEFLRPAVDNIGANL